MKLFQQGFWVGLAVILPIAGALVYALFLLLSRLMNPVPSAEESVPRRITQPMPALGPARIRSTIPAAESPKGTIPMAAVEPTPPQKPASRRLQVWVVEGPDAGQTSPLERLPAVIGRSQVASIQVARDPLVSRQHAEIYEQDGSLRLRDLGSLHGTLLNNQNLQDAPLAPGDRIRVGSSVLVVQAARE